MGILGFFIPAVAHIEEHHGASATPVPAPEPAAGATTV
jgi:hypothetical protein